MPTQKEILLRATLKHLEALAKMHEALAIFFTGENKLHMEQKKIDILHLIDDIKAELKL